MPGGEEPLALLGLSGSLRVASSNRNLLDAASMLAPAQTVVTVFDGLRGLPHFDADLDDEERLPASAAAWRQQVRECDGLIISCPEYAGGLPGAFKNALDWLVGEPGFQAKPVAILNASPRSVLAQESLRIVLRTMSADIVDAAAVTIPILGTALDAPAITANQTFSGALSRALAAFAEHIRMRNADHTF
ncbi:chromate reductase [Sphingomonas sp. UYAg733]